MDLARELQSIVPRSRPSPWRGYEHVLGYAVMALPFSSGHLLGLRVFPETDFAPYQSVWHRTPQGEWSIYNDGPSLDTTCPRAWGPVLRHAVLTRIEIAWTGPNELRVEMQKPALSWRMTLGAPPWLRALNAVHARLPLWTWKPAPLRRLREWASARLLGLGELQLAFTTPSRQDTRVLFSKVLYIESAQATWEGQDLGVPVRLDANPTIGGVPLPLRPTFVVGQAQARIRDRAEYERTRARVRAATLET